MAGPRVEIIASPILPIYLDAVASESNDINSNPTRGLGDAAIAWFVANAPFLRGPHTTTLVLTEDAAFGDSVLGRDVHVLSTRALLRTLENLDIIPSADAILDRPALVGARRSRKSHWKPAS